MSRLGPNRVIAVLNEAFGEATAESLPFDMRHLRWPLRYKYGIDDDKTVKNREFASLRKLLSTQLKLIVQSDFDSPQDQNLFKPFAAVDGISRFTGHSLPLGSYDGHGITMDVYLAGGPAAWLRLYPEYKQERVWRPAELRELVVGFLLPMTSPGSHLQYDYLRSEDGFGCCVSLQKHGLAETAVKVFQTGEIWAVSPYVAQAVPEGMFVDIDMWRLMTEQYVGFLRVVGVRGDLKWEAGYEGVRGRKLVVDANSLPTHISQNPSRASASHIVSRTGLVTGSSTKGALRPFMEEVLHACGDNPTNWSNWLSRV